jgi:hypothetical protein
MQPGRQWPRRYCRCLRMSPSARSRRSHRCFRSSPPLPQNRSPRHVPSFHRRRNGRPVAHRECRGSTNCRARPRPSCAPSAASRRRPSLRKSARWGFCGASRPSDWAAATARRRRKISRRRRGRCGLVRHLSIARRLPRLRRDRRCRRRGTLSRSPNMPSGPRIRGSSPSVASPLCITRVRRISWRFLPSCVAKRIERGNGLRAAFGELPWTALLACGSAWAIHRDNCPNQNSHSAWRRPGGCARRGFHRGIRGRPDNGCREARFATLGRPGWGALMVTVGKKA